MADKENVFKGHSLVDMLGIDMSEIEAKKQGEVLPKLIGDFTCVASETKPLNDSNENLRGAIITWEWKLDAIHEVMDKNFSGDPATLVGKIHKEVQFITSPDSFPYVKGHIKEVGGDQNGALNVLIKSVEGKRVRASIGHRKDPNDSEKVYANLSRVKPIEAAPMTPVAA